MRSLFRLTTALLLSHWLLAATADAQLLDLPTIDDEPEPRVEVRLIRRSPSDAILSLEITLPPECYVYAIDAAASVATQVKITESRGVVFESETVFKASHRGVPEPGVEEPELVHFGQVRWTRDVALADPQAPQDAQVGGILKMQVCSDAQGWCRPVDIPFQAGLAGGSQLAGEATTRRQISNGEGTETTKVSGSTPIRSVKGAPSGSRILFLSLWVAALLAGMYWVAKQNSLARIAGTGAAVCGIALSPIVYFVCDRSGDRLSASASINSPPGTGEYVDSADSKPVEQSGTAGVSTRDTKRRFGGSAMTEVVNPFDGSREIEFSNGTRIDGGFEPTPGSEISVPNSESDPVDPFGNSGSRSSRNRNLNGLAFPESTDGGFVEPNSDPTAGLFGK